MKSEIKKTPNLVSELRNLKGKNVYPKAVKSQLVKMLKPILDESEKTETLSSITTWNVAETDVKSGKDKEFHSQEKDQ